MTSLALVLRYEYTPLLLQQTHKCFIDHRSSTSLIAIHFVPVLTTHIHLLRLGASKVDYNEVAYEIGYSLIIVESIN